MIREAYINRELLDNDFELPTEALSNRRSRGDTDVLLDKGDGRSIGEAEFIDFDKMLSDRATNNEVEKEFDRLGG